MRPLTRRSRVVPLLVAVALAGTAIWAEARPDSPQGPEIARRPPAFTIRGRVSGLYPGAKRTLVVRVKNKERTAIALKRIWVKGKRGDSDCPGQAISVRRWRGRRVVRPGRTVKIRLIVRMKKGAPNGCQGTRFRLAYAGKAVRP